MQTLVQWTKISFDYFIPQQTFQTILLSLDLGNPRPPPPPPPPLLPFLKGNMVYTILHNTNVSLSILHILCVHPETTATLLFTLQIALKVYLRSRSGNKVWMIKSNRQFFFILYKLYNNYPSWTQKLTINIIIYFENQAK